MEKIGKSEDTTQITISKDIKDKLDSIANMIRACGCSNDGNRPYSQAIRYALIVAGLWDEERRIDITHDTFFCYDLGIPLTANDYCHEDSCRYTAKCSLMKPLSFDTNHKKTDTTKKNMTKKRFAGA